MAEKTVAGKRIIDIFFYGKAFRLFLLLSEDDPTNLTNLSRKSGITPSWVVNLIKNWKNLGLVETKKTGRTRIIRLSQYGVELRNTFDSVLLSPIMKKRR